MGGRRAVVGRGHVEQQVGVADLADVGIVGGAAVEEIAAARGEGDLGKFVGADGRGRLSADDLRHEQPVRMEEHGFWNARGEEMVVAVFATDRRAAPNPVIGQLEATADDGGLQARDERR